MIALGHLEIILLKTKDKDDIKGMSIIQNRFQFFIVAFVAVVVDIVVVVEVVIVVDIAVVVIDIAVVVVVVIVVASIIAFAVVIFVVVVVVVAVGMKSVDDGFLLRVVVCTAVNVDVGVVVTVVVDVLIAIAVLSSLTLLLLLKMAFLNGVIVVFLILNVQGGHKNISKGHGVMDKALAGLAGGRGSTPVKTKNFFCFRKIQKCAPILLGTLPCELSLPQWLGVTL